MGMAAILLGMGGHGFHIKMGVHPKPMGADGRGRGHPMLGSGSHSMLLRVRHNPSVCLLPY